MIQIRRLGCLTVQAGLAAVLGVVGDAIEPSEGLVVTI